LNNLNSRKKNIKLIDLLGQEAQDKLNDLSEKYNKTLRSEITISEELVIDKDNLSLNRKNGSWYVQAPLYRKYTHEGNGSSEYDITDLIDTDIKLPHSITSYDTLCIDWETIKKKYPLAKDAVSSPNKDMLLILTSNELLVFINPENGIGNPSVRIPVASTENIILNQWATNEYVEKWSKLLGTY